VQELLGITREIGFNAINIDLIYGLPHQTLTSFAKTIEQVIQLLPERIALYSYAYVPWIHKHQAAMDQSVMGDAESKIALFLQAREQFIASGYCAIAMDHFALADDELAKAYNSGTIRRNFMGYTTLATESYIGLGVSAIGYIGNSFIQNHKSLKQYYATLDARQLPTARGYQLHGDDLMRQWVISSLMCKFVVDKIEFKEKFSLEFDSYFASELAEIKAYVAQEMITIEENNIQVLAKGKCFVRNICMHFDAYLVKQSHTQQFSKTV
jgi:oxygen-independent coproporphyrinogen-3 oxidase